MKGDPLPDADHVIRHCRERDIKADENGPRGIFPFALDSDPDGLSVTWMEFFQGSLTDQISSVREAIGRQRRIRKSNRLALLNVGKIRSIGRSFDTELRVEHDPDLTPRKENPAHSLVIGIQAENEDLKNRLAMEALSRIEPGVLE